MKKNIVFLLILIPIIWISCDGMGHQTIDFRKIENLMPQHPDSALMLLEQIENKENLSRKDKAHYYLLLTEAEDKTYVTHTTDSLISIAADYYEKTDDLGRKAKAWYYKGRINQDLGHPLKAQEYYLKALRDEEKIEDHALLGRIHNHIGMLYAYQKVYEKALPFQKKAVENFHLLSDSTGQVFALRDLGRTFLMLGHQDSAIICNQKAIALMRKRIIPSVYTELAGFYIDRQRLEEAHGLLRTSLQNVAKPQAKYPVYLVLGELYKKSGQIDSACFYLQACINSAPLPETRAGGLFHLKEIALEKGQWEQAALLSKQYKADRLKQAEKLNPEQRSMRLLKEIQSELHLDKPPLQIECFDNSNIQGSDAVAACVVFKKAKPSKKDYRKYNIKTVVGPDDYASMKEVVRRRYQRAIEENSPLPDLIITDGGKGQMEVVREVIEDELHLNIPIAGLAKDNKHRTSELLFGFPAQTIGIKQQSSLFRLLTQIQDEVHRFAITFHRDKRSKRQVASALDSIKGIGEKTKTALLKEFKSVKRIKEASLEEIAKVIGEVKAQTVKKGLSNE